MSVTSSPDQPLVGRAQELAQLLNRFDEAAAGRGGAVLISGEPGIGKTRLARAFAAEAASRGAAVLWGRSFEGDWSPPLAPWVEAIGGFVRATSVERVSTLFGLEPPSGAAILASLVPELAPYASALGAPASFGADDDRARLHEAVSTLFARLSLEQPVLIVLEDLHWADTASLDLLRHLAFFSPTDRTLIVGTYRELELSPSHSLSALLTSLRREQGTLSLQLRGLTVEDVESLLGASAPTAWSGQLARTIHFETRGNPFFIEELTRHLVDVASSTGGGEWSIDDPMRDLAIPEGVRQVVSRRLARLSEPAQKLLTHAAVFTGGFDFAVLQSLTDLSEDELLDSIDESLAARMLEPDVAGPERYDFVHSIVRHALSETWSPSRRVRLHRRAAEALTTAYAGQEQLHAAELAEQFHRSSSLPGAVGGVPHALVAANQAGKAYARDAVVRFLRIARDLSAGEPPVERAAILCQLAIAESEAVMGAEAVATTSDALAALEEANTPTDQIADFIADVVKVLKQSAYVDTRVWRPLLEHGLRLAEDEHGRPWAKLMLLTDPVVPVAREVVRAGRWVGFDRDAIDIARATGNEEDYARSFESFDVRTRAQTDALVDQARGWQRAAAVMYGLTVAANDYQYRHGAFRDAAALWEELLTLGEKYGAINWQAQANNQLTWLHIAAGRFGQARETQAAAIALLDRLGPGRRSNVLEMEMETSFAIYQNGDWAQFAAFWAAFVDEPGLGPTDPTTLTGTLYGALAAHAYAEAGDRESALRLLTSLSEIFAGMSAVDTNQNGAVGWAVSAAWRLGATEFASVLRRAALDLLDAGVGDYPQTSNYLSLARTAAMAGDRDEALAAFAEARETLSLSGQRPLFAIAELDEATVHAKGGPANYQRVMDLLESAITTFEDLEMPVWLERAETAKREADARLGGRSPLPGGLTEREADVLRLVARGYSDRQISDDLFISPRTVNAHLRNMLNKANVSNRTELSIWAFEQGLVTRE